MGNGLESTGINFHTQSASGKAGTEPDKLLRDVYTMVNRIESEMNKTALVPGKVGGQTPNLNFNFPKFSEFKPPEGTQPGVPLSSPAVVRATPPDNNKINGVPVDPTTEPSQLNQPDAEAIRKLQALKGSEVRDIQDNIHNRLGITGQDVTVDIVDFGPGADKDKPGLVGLVGKHATETGEVVSGTPGINQGVAPGATVAHYALGGFTELQNDSEEAVKRYIVDDAAALPNGISRVMQSLMKDNSGKRHVLNASLTTSVISEARKLEMDTLGVTDPTTGKFLNPNIRNAIYGADAENLTVGEKRQKLLEYVRSTLNQDIESNGTFKQAMDHYQGVARQASDKGIVLMIAAGNDHGYFQETQHHPGDEINFLTLSDSVNSIGASDTHQTPGKRGDDTVADFSSRGHVSLAAPGNEIPVVDPYAPASGEIQVVDGSSFASPYASGVAALMLQANPGLSAQQIQQILAQSAEKGPGLSGDEVGAGFINPEKAVALALQQRSSVTRQAA